MKEWREEMEGYRGEKGEGGGEEKIKQK